MVEAQKSPRDDRDGILLVVDMGHLRDMGIDVIGKGLVPYLNQFLFRSLFKNI